MSINQEIEIIFSCYENYYTSFYLQLRTKLPRYFHRVVHHHHLFIIPQHNVIYV